MRTRVELPRFKRRECALSKVPEYFGDLSAEYAQKQYRSGARTFIAVRHATVLGEIAALHLPTKTRVLDAGCGPGFLSRDLLDLGFAVESLDLSEGMVLEARKTIGAARASVSLGSIEALPYADASFDLVCCCGVIEYLPDYIQAAREFLRVLRPGGYLILPTTNLYAPANYLYPLVEFAKSSAWLRRIYRASPRRDFPMHFHSPSRMARRLQELGFTLLPERFFFLLPIPRPLNVISRGLSSRIERFMARFGRTPLLRRIGEGYLPICRK